MIEKIKQLFLKLFKQNGMPPAEHQSVSTIFQPEFFTYYVYTFKTELQIVMRDNQVICSDYETSYTTYNKSQEVERDGNEFIYEYIKNAYKIENLKTFDKSNKHYTIIPTTEIKKILYKEPSVSVESKQERNPYYVANQN